MKRIGILVLAAVLMAVPALAGDTTKTIAGFGIGHGVTGTQSHETFTFAFAGARLATLDEGVVYGVYQRGDVQGSEIGGHGASIIYAQPIQKLKSVWLMVDLGILNDIATNADGDLVPGLTIGAGLSWQATDKMNLDCYLKAWDTGPDFSAIVYGALHLENPLEIIKKIL